MSRLLFINGKLAGSSLKFSGARSKRELPLFGDGMYDRNCLQTLCTYPVISYEVRSLSENFTGRRFHRPCSHLGMMISDLLPPPRPEPSKLPLGIGRQHGPPRSP
ncbi:unnamed protein product [Laminaria digitata]